MIDGFDLDLGRCFAASSFSKRNSIVASTLQHNSTVKQLDQESSVFHQCLNSYRECMDGI